MRRAMSLLSSVVVLTACSGAHGVEPGHPTTSVPDPPSTTPPTAAIEWLISPNPIAVPRTTTTTTTTTTVPDPPAPVPPNPTGLGAGDGTDGTSDVTAPAPSRLVALTFDDGPFVGWTESILQTLDRYDVTATFFVSTYLLPGNAHLIPAIVAAGHSVQTHGDLHEVLTGRDEASIRADLETSIEKLMAAGAPRPTCLRPPHGMTDETVERVAGELGLAVVGWDVNSFDYSLQESAAVIDAVLDHTVAGSVVLLHDHWAPIHEDTLPVIVTELRARGLEFGPLCATG